MVGEDQGLQSQALLKVSRHSKTNNKLLLAPLDSPDASSSQKHDLCQKTQETNLFTAYRKLENRQDDLTAPQAKYFTLFLIE